VLLIKFLRYYSYSFKKLVLKSEDFGIYHNFYYNLFEDFVFFEV